MADDLPTDVDALIATGELQRLESHVQEAWHKLINEAFVSTRFPSETRLVGLRENYTYARKKYMEAGGKLGFSALGTL